MKNDNLLESIKNAIADGNHEEARTLLRVALKEPTAEIYYLASQVALNDQQRQSFLKKADEIASSHLLKINTYTTEETRDKPNQSFTHNKQGYLSTAKLIMGGVLALIPIAIFLFSNTNHPNSENRPSENEIQQPQSQSIQPAQNPSPSPTKTQLPEPTSIARKEIFLRPTCDKTIRVDSDQPIRIIYGLWASKGKALAQETYSSVNAELSINGRNYAGKKSNEIMPMQEIPCGTKLAEAYWTFYTIDLGDFIPGEYTITVDFWFADEVTDGYDLNGDGVLDKYKNPFNQKFTLIVN
jgi:hypothetical protein